MMNAKYDRIGIGYNTTRKADPYLLGRMVDLLETPMNGKCLDIGCGTGNYTIALRNLGLDILGIDPSEEMLHIARSKSAAITWLKGVAEALPFDDGSFDSILASLTIHHWRDVHKGLGEAARVLKPGGKIVLFTATPAQMDGYWLGHYFPKMLHDSTKQMPHLATIAATLQANGLKLHATEKYFIQDDLQDLFLMAGKRNPSIYFQPEIRKGISSFAAVANEAEVQAGLARLAADIDSDQVSKVIQSYDNDEGDYLFVVGQK